MIKYRILIVLFCLLVPVSVVWGEVERQPAPGKTPPWRPAPEQNALEQKDLEQSALEENALKVTTPERFAIVTGDYVNLRAAASGSAVVVTRLMRGGRVTVLEVVESWTRVRLANGSEGWISNKYIAAEPVTVASRSRIPSLIPDIISYAKSFLGTKYVYGGASPKGFDCSGFTMFVFNQFQMKLPHESSSQIGVGVEVPTMEDLLPGDLVFFKTLGSARVNHVGIYLGEQQFIHASSGRGNVIISPLNTGYYKNCYTGARRLGIVTSPNYAGE